MGRDRKRTVGRHFGVAGCCPGMLLSKNCRARTPLTWLGREGRSFFTPVSNLDADFSFDAHIAMSDVA